MAKKYIDAELLKTKIKERIEELDEQIVDLSDSKAVLKNQELLRVLALIDSLQQEQDLIVINKKDWEVQEQFRKNKVFGKPFQQEQQENKPNLLKSLEEYFEKTPKEQLDADWEKLKVWDEIGPDVETYCKTQREQQEVDLEKEIDKTVNECTDGYNFDWDKFALHFYELGKKL